MPQGGSATYVGCFRDGKTTGDRLFTKKASIIDKILFKWCLADALYYVSSLCEKLFLKTRNREREREREVLIHFD